MLVIAWAWVIITCFPGLILSFISVIQDQASPRLIPKFAHWALIVFTIFYLAFVMISFFAEVGATQGQLSMKAYRLRTLLWLVPIQLILLTGYYLMFFSKRQLFKPNFSAIVQVAREEARKWEQRGDDIRNRLYQWISEGRVLEVLEHIKNQEEKNGGEHLDEIVLLLNQLNRNQRDQNMQLISQEHAQITQNRIAVATMELVKNK